MTYTSYADSQRYLETNGFGIVSDQLVFAARERTTPLCRRDATRW